MSQRTEFIQMEITTTEIVQFEASAASKLLWGVEATSFLQNMIKADASANEPLLAALGGAPLSLKKNIAEELDRWTEHHMKPLFVFDGQSIVGACQSRLARAARASVHTQRAWRLYSENKPIEAVAAFGASGAIDPHDLYGVLQEVLDERELPFKVAPSSACAQLAAIIKSNDQYIDGIMGSQELLLYDIDGAVYLPPTGSDWQSKTFRAVSKEREMKNLKVSEDTYVDALLMTGTSFLPYFPPFDTHDFPTQPFSVQTAVTLLNASQQSIESACSTYDDIIKSRDPNWLDKFRKAKMWVQHPIVARSSGEIKPKNWDTLTRDNKDYLGFQLPPEVHHYHAVGLLNTRVIDPLVSLQCIIYPTLDGRESEDYKNLVTNHLIPLKEVTFYLMLAGFHRGWTKSNTMNIEMRYWFDDKKNQKLLHKNVESISKVTKAWTVKELAAWSKNEDLLGNRLFAFAVSSLDSKDAARKTISSKPPAALVSDTTILAHAVYRFLQFRNYIDESHELTSWGKALAKTLTTLKPIIKKHGNTHHIEEAALLAYELLQFGCLHSRNPLQHLIGGPLRGPDEQKASCMLVSRTACLLKVRHKEVGYTGPLSQNFLSFYSIIKEVRQADRDLLEANITSMFIEGQAKKNRDDASYRKIAKRIPLGEDISVSMGIAVKTYLDDLISLDHTPAQRQAAKQEYGGKYLPKHENIAEDLDVAFDFFAALYEGVKTLNSGELSEFDMKAWDSADEYLKARR